MTRYSHKPLKLRTKQFRIVVNDEIKQSIFGDIFEKLWKMNVLWIYVCSTSEVQCKDRKTTERAFNKFENTNR